MLQMQIVRQKAAICANLNTCPERVQLDSRTPNGLSTCANTVVSSYSTIRRLLHVHFLRFLCLPLTLAVGSACIADDTLRRNCTYQTGKIYYKCHSKRVQSCVTRCTHVARLCPGKTVPLPQLPLPPLCRIDLTSINNLLAMANAAHV